MCRVPNIKRLWFRHPLAALKSRWEAPKGRTAEKGHVRFSVYHNSESNDDAIFIYVRPRFSTEPGMTGPQRDAAGQAGIEGGAGDHRE
jgi:hypothetical protein